MKISMNIRDIASILNAEIIGNEDLLVDNLADIRDAESTDIAFISNKKYLKYIKESKAGAIIIDKNTDLSSYPGRTFLLVDNSYNSLRLLLEKFDKYSKYNKSKSGISDKASVSPLAVIGDNVYIGDFVTIEDNVIIGDNSHISNGCFVGIDSKIGKNTFLYPNVTVLHNCFIGDNVIIHSGTVIGSDGFGYVFENGKHIKLPQIGKVIIEDDVEIGSNVSIDRATFDATVISKGTKIDNLVQIAHNVKIGKNTIVVSQVGIAGSTEIGDYVVIGGQVGIVGHIKIGNGVQIAAKSGVMNDIPEGQVYSGAPARPHREFMRLNVILNRMLKEKGRDKE